VKEENLLGDHIGSVILVQHVGDDKGIVNAARVSFGQDQDDDFTERDAKLLGYLIAHQHGSPYEHNSMTFKVVAPIFVVRQWQRHRVGVSFNEISARYTEVLERYYIPLQFRAQAKDNRQASVVDAEGVVNQMAAQDAYKQSCEFAMASYRNLLNLGVAKEQARGVLPVTMYTEFFFTCNLRALLHFLELREHPGAQWEIQRYANALKSIAIALFPETFNALDKIKSKG